MATERITPGASSQAALIAVLLLTLAIGSPADALANGLRRSPMRIAASYFADLNVHRYARAARLEAPCKAVYSRRLPGTSIDSSTGLHGRDPNIKAEARNLSFVRVAHITRIRRYTTPDLTEFHIVGADVRGWFKFVYRNGKTSPRFPKGSYDMHVILRRCAGVWGVDSEWLNGSPAEAFGGVCRQQCNAICDSRGCRRLP